MIALDHAHRARMTDIANRIHWRAMGISPDDLIGAPSWAAIELYIVRQMLAGAR